MSENFPFRDFKDLSKTIKDNVHILPEDIDLIVGIPRSGMIPAYMIGLFLNKKVCSINELIENIVPSYGNRMPNEKRKNIHNILVVDDSICTGRAIIEAKEKLKNLDYNIKYLCIYTNNVNNHLVDYTFEYAATPRLFQWNYMNMIWTEKSCFDIDGVLCVDPTKEENDDGEKYRKFLLNAKPLFVPQFCINTIVTSRLEKYRYETETWLRKNNIKYNRLIMLDLKSQEERIKLKAHANLKAHVYKKLEDTCIFVESDSKQAQKIAVLSGKTVICSSTDEIYYGDSITDRRKIEEKVEVKIQSSPKEMLVDSYNKNTNVDVSVIIPIHNLENYLQECLNTIRYQSFDNIEIICINDGSTDRSLDILNKNAEIDNRIIIINQECQYAGVARNKGIEIATGKYVLFLDGDDFFEKDLIYKVYSQIDSTNSDICLFKCRTYDNETHKYAERDFELRKNMIPSNKKSFNRTDIPDFIFNITTGAPWSKMFLKKFIMENNIRFQNTHHYNDLYFVMTAMMMANRITYLDETLVNYRINRKDSLQANMEMNPLEFTTPLLAIKECMVKNGLYKMLNKSFMNRCLSTSLYVLFSQKNFYNFKQVYNELKNNYFTQFGLDEAEVDSNDIYIKNNYNQLIKIYNNTPEDFMYSKENVSVKDTEEIKKLKWRCKDFERAIKSKNQRIEELKFEIKKLNLRLNEEESYKYNYTELLKSRTFKLSRAITWIPRKIKEKRKK